MKTIYVEKAVAEEPMTKELLARYESVPHIFCDRYTEIFNRKNQNFRLQKKNPSLILAKKHQNLVLPTPIGYGIGGKNNYYFSHLLNCVYDCRYCFLQGMFRSANYVLFVNFAHFQKAILDRLEEHSNPVYFFSGYDCDSLAMEGITQFGKKFLPFFEKHQRAILELRTKSTNCTWLLKRKPIKNVVVAYTLSPHNIAEAHEHRAPKVKRRLKALKKLQESGWSIGLRFDPMIDCSTLENTYGNFFKEVFSILNPNQIHSVTLGTFRVPRELFKRMTKLYPEEKLFAHSLEDKGGTIACKREGTLISFCSEELLKYISKEVLFTHET